MKTTLLALLAIGTTGALTASGQAPPRAARPAPAASQASQSQPSPGPGAAVTLLGDTLFTLYGSLGPFGPAERATAADRRIRQWVDSQRDELDSVQVVSRGQYSEIVAAGVVLVTVLDADAAALGRPRANVAAEVARAIQDAGRSAGQALSAQGLLLSVLYLALATGVLALLLWLMSAAFPRLYQRAEALKDERRVSIRIQRFELLSAARVSEFLIVSARVVRAAITLLLLYVYVPLALSFFPWTQSLSGRIVGYAVRPLARGWSAFIDYLPNVFYVALIVIATRLVLWVISAIFRALRLGAIRIEGFHRDWADPTYKIVRAVVLAFTAIVVFPYLPGAQTDAFKGVSIFVGVILSFGSSAAVGNVIAGVVLTYTRAFGEGDRVKIGDAVGDVTERTLLVTRLRTIKNEEITIPNGQVLGGSVTNYTRRVSQRSGLILHTTVTIGYDTPWRKVEELLIAAARNTANIQEHPAPYVLQTRLDDFYVAYEINASTDRPDLMAGTYSALHANIQDAFAGAGVEIMSPHYRSERDGNKPALPPKAP